MNHLLVILGIMIFGLIVQTSHAEVSVSIDIEKEIYHYGDFLVFTIQVSEIIDEYAILHIIDEAGKSSSAIPILISDTKTVVPSPFPFESIIYPQGRYTLNIEYSGSSDTVEFELVDAGNLVIPYWIKELATDWTGGIISDNEYRFGIKHIAENVLDIPEMQENSSEIKIPQWIKTPTAWWANGMIPDNDYALSLEFLIKEKIIII